MKHFVFGGVTTAPEVSARNNEEMQIAKIKEIKIVTLPRNLSMPKNFKIAKILNWAIHRSLLGHLGKFTKYIGVVIQILQLLFTGYSLLTHG